MLLGGEAVCGSEGTAAVTAVNAMSAVSRVGPIGVNTSFRTKELTYPLIMTKVLGNKCTGARNNNRNKLPNTLLTSGPVLTSARVLLLE